MYTLFYKLKAKPFQISSDPDFMWLGEKHKEALATLRYGILDNKGFLLLTGDVGTGKTTLINSLIQSLSDDIICTTVPDPSLSKLDFFNYIASSFGIDHEFSSKGAFLSQFRKFLLETYEGNKKVLLIIDEAQVLTQELLEEIRLLSNIEKTNTKLINIFFVGQNEFNEILNQEQNRAVRQRLTLNYNIDPLSLNETEEYIKHRLKVAGSTQPIFESSAVREVFIYSGGFPRRINIICDHALLSGYVKDCETIGADIIQECAKELTIPAYVRNRNINGIATPSPKPIPNIQSQTIIVKPKQPEKKQNRVGRLIAGIVVFLLLFVFCWWLLFPVNFNQFMSNSNDHLYLLKNVTNSMNSESPKPSMLIGKIEDKKNRMNQPGKIDDQSKDQKELNIKQENILSKTINQDVNNSQVKTIAQHNDLEALQSGKKIPEPFVQDGLEIANKNLSKDIIQLSNTSAKQLESNNGKKLDSLVAEIPKKFLPLPEKIIIKFKYNTNDLTEEGFAKLKEFSDILITHPETKVLISGYTDSDGDQQYNIKLSEFRANIVKSYLLGKGSKSDQIEIKGMGNLNPIESNDTAWGKMMNRRVEIEVIK